MHVDDTVNDTRRLACDQRTAGEEKTYGPHSNWNGKLSTLGNYSDASERCIALLRAIPGSNWRTG